MGRSVVEADTGTQIDKIRANDPLIIFRDEIVEARRGDQHGRDSRGGFDRGKVARKTMLVREGLERPKNDSAASGGISLSGRTDIDGHWKPS